VPTRVKSIAAVAVAVALVVVVAGCSPSASTSDTGEYGSDTVSLWYISDAEPIVAPAIARFEAENPGVTVDATAYANDDLNTKLTVALGTKAAPDVFVQRGGSFLDAQVKAGQLASLDSVVADGGLADSIGKGSLATGQIDGSQWAVPVLSDSSMVWYNTEIFAQKNVSVPTTWEEFIQVIKTLKADGVTPIAMANKTQWPGLHWWSEIVTLACGPDVLAGIGASDTKYDFTDPCFVEAGKRIQELVEAGAFNEGFNGLDYDTGESRQLFWSGTAAMNHMGNWTVAAALAEAPDMVSKMDFFTVPAWSGAKGSTDMMTGGIGMAWSVTQKSGDSANALALVSYLSDAKTGQVAADNGRIPVIAGVSLADPLLGKVAEAINKASAFQQWPDVVLDPTLATAVYDQSQALFGLETDPQSAADALQAALDEVRK
jgi:raffinose/stachyose/melibiose transport system substrate-binding protein